MKGETAKNTITVANFDIPLSKLNKVGMFKKVMTQKICVIQ